jgi:two-component sensor histidine kinase
MRHVNLDLPADAKAPRRARRSLVELDTVLDEEQADTVRLLVTELVTNSVKFAGEGTIEVRLKLGKNAVHVEVLDDGPGFVPSGGRPALTDTSGRGLYLVEALSNRWGVSMDGRTCVWFEIDSNRQA